MEQDLHQQRIGDFLDELSGERVVSGDSAFAQEPLENVAFHDFAFHEYLLPTETGFTANGLSPDAMDILDDLKGQAGVAVDALADLLEHFERAVRSGVGKYRDLSWDIDTLVDAILGSFYGSYATHVPAMLNAYDIERRDGIAPLFFGFLESAVELFLRDRLRSMFPRYEGVWADWADSFDTSYAAWHDYVNHDPTQDLPDWAGPRPVSVAEAFRRDHPDPNPQAGDYPFEVFPAHSVNAGLRLVYRQEWRPLAIQVGEIVRTIPLGPGERVKVTRKQLRRQKVTSTLETLTEAETTTESTESTKDSSEIAREAADMFKWNVDAKASASFGFASAEVSTSFGGRHDKKTRSTSSNLSEAMEKAASKVRRETKYVVATEREAQFEEENFSEIHNANTEVAVTYQYAKLQQQYEVFTYLAEVQSVLFVAEEVPARQEINDEWVRSHDWVLAKVLKDESFRGTLNELIQDMEERDPLGDSLQADPNSLTNPFNEMRAQAHTRFAKFASEGMQPGQGGQAGLSVPDIYAEPQRIYQEYLRERAARQRANLLREVRRERLYEHIRNNILYYCRAIWEHEDSDQRLLRYKKEGRRVPIEWTAPFSMRRVGQRSFVRFPYTPTGRTAPLWQLIDVTGPLGYVGNYAVFGIRAIPGQEEIDNDLILERFQGRRTLTLADLLAEMRAPYVENGELLDPALRQSIAEAQAQNALSKAQIEDLISYLPELSADLLDANGEPDPSRVSAQHPISAEQWGAYLYKKNATRRFLVDSNNLYLSLFVGNGAALEPFKRAHRYIDVVRAEEELRSIALQNKRRDTHMAHEREYDPDIEKVVIVGDAAGSLMAGSAAAHEVGEAGGVSTNIAPSGAETTPGPGGGGTSGSG